MRVLVVPHDPSWPDEYQREAEQVVRALAERLVRTHHIGSTAIPTIHAKPVIDLLVEVDVIDRVDECNPAMGALGYECMGELGIPGRRYFRKSDPAGSRTHHCHVFSEGSDQVHRHLAFRDYMIAHPERAQEYSELKQRLAGLHPDDFDGYMDGKDAFIQETDRLAAAWRASTAM